MQNTATYAEIRDPLSLQTSFVQNEPTVMPVLYHVLVSNHYFCCLNICFYTSKYEANKEKSQYHWRFLKKLQKSHQLVAKHVCLFVCLYKCNI